MYRMHTIYKKKKKKKTKYPMQNPYIYIYFNETNFYFTSIYELSALYIKVDFIWYQPETGKNWNA